MATWDSDLKIYAAGQAEANRATLQTMAQELLLLRELERAVRAGGETLTVLAKLDQRFQGPLKRGP